MADVMDMPPEPPLLRDDKRRDRIPDRKERSVDDRRRDRDPRDRREDGNERDERLSRRDHFERRSDDERPGSALARDRDRDYKRRRTPSLSPPPLYGHRERDRRPSPLRRSPSYKRSRREDDYDAGRRGSPRMGMDDRRDRRMGAGAGRNNSYMGDERSYGRHHGFRPELGRGGGFGDGSFSSFDAGPRRDGLMTYKQFITELEDDISPTEAERRYTEYRSEFISTQKKAFFEQNKQEDWLRDKYDPSRLEAVIQRRNEACKVAAREFILELESGSLDTSPNFAGQNSQAAHEGSDEEADDRRRRNGRGFAKENELDTAPKAPAISCEPRRIEKDVEQARALVRKLDGEKGIERNILVTSDLDKADGERPMINPIVIVRGANHVKGYEGVELLDVVITYLWRIHYVDYYGSKEYKEQPKVMRHVRGEAKANEDMASSAEWEKKVDATWQGRLQGQDPLELMLGKEKMESVTTQALEPLIRKIKDEKYGWKYGCGAKNCTKLFHGPEFVQKHLKLKHPELVQDVAVKVYDELYFENYMSDAEAPGSTPVMASQKERSRRPPRPGVPDEPTRISTSLPLPAPGRGGSREADRGARGVRESEKPEKPEKPQEDEPFEQRNSEQSPSQDFQQSGGPFDSAGPFEGGRGDTPMFDHFGGPGGMRGPPPFGADMGMPPVLMPVPGAGPLGPFVPAPPEVAMRLWREQGGAGPFHPGVYDGPFDGEGGNSRGGNRTRTGPSGGGRMGAGLIDTPLPLPLPAVRPDSRRPLRSYRDLDAPEDEVTVIDYRSL
eukprot:c15664_g1_i1 orf=644-2995(-)